LSIIRVGITERHGMADEASRHPPEGVEYSFLKSTGPPPFWMRSPIRGYLRRFEAGENDLVESVLSPILTRDRWVYSCEDCPAAVAFNFLGAPLPRQTRMAYITRLLRQANCRRIVMWSEAGRATWESYGRVRDRAILDKLTVVYPAIGRVDDALTRRGDGPVSMLFTGDFFRKGGLNVLDAFERLRQEFPDLTLTLCCDEQIHFQTANQALRNATLSRIRSLPGIVVAGMVPRARLLTEILPRTDIYLLPTYIETFGFAVLEAMAYGIPVVATNYFALPEMISQGTTGFMIDTTRFDCANLFRGYVVNDIPSDFREHVTAELLGYLRQLIASAPLRREMGQAGLRLARDKFSIARRNEAMRAVYRDAVA
jgi:glycosyltransferase involved in cell wall biosynthesis